MINLSKQELASFNVKDINFDLASFNNIQWKYQSCDEKSLLVLNLINDKSFIEKHLEKLLSIKPAVILTNSFSVCAELKNVTNVICSSGENFFKLRSFICDKKYKINQAQKVIGVTGTNGKTSIANYLVQVALNNNKSAYTIGTLGVYDGKYKYDFGLTTPDYVDLRKYLDEFYECDLLVLEASSHALEQNRFYNLKFDLACWSNLTQDHLDYHEDMNSYFKAKKKIVKYLKLNSKLLISSDMTKYLEDLPIDITKVISDFELELPSLIDNAITRKNLALVQAAYNELFEAEIKDFSYLKPIPGRFNTFISGSVKAIVDFAHTPDALENICKQIKSENVNKFVVVFGCGGDRDNRKRPLMGDIAYKFSDYVIVANDNPRTEVPINIAKDIIKNFTDDNKYEIILDRSLAIKKAFEICNDGVILIAGKGHEEYIDMNNEKKYYSDIEEVKKNIR